MRKPKQTKPMTQKSRAEADKKGLTTYAAGEHLHVIYLLRCYMDRSVQAGAKQMASDILAWSKDLPCSAEEKAFFEKGAKANSGLQILNERTEWIDKADWVCYNAPHRGNMNPGRYVKQLHDIIKAKDKELLKFFGTRVGFQQGKCVIDLSGKSAFYP